MQTFVKTQGSMQATREFSKRLLLMAAMGGTAFWITDFIMAVSPIAASYQAAFSFTSLMIALMEAFVGGLIIALCVSYLLLRFYSQVTGKKPIVKAMILGFMVMLCIEVVSTLINPAQAAVYLLRDTGMNMPRFLALGLILGILYDKLK